ncbi:MAG: MASE1 domain-containing protein, partial [Candidatus Omnitrophica bacterium]|nr:MASE1 domain-containing protein [Candidatus Omnitrophota bacterium]
TWWLGDVSGILVVTPAILAWSALRIRWWNPWRAAEATLSLGALAVTGQMVFGELVRVGGLPFPLLYALLPLVMWAALRFGQGGVTISILVVSGMAIWNTANGLGPFAVGTLNESLLWLQVFVGIVAVTGLVLAAAVAEQEQTQAALRSARDELERRVRERTAELSDSNAQLRQQVTERQRAEQHLIKAAKLESVGRLAAGVAHEVKNPLATLLIGLEHLSDCCGPLDDEAQRLLRDMQHAVHRADAVIRGLLNFSSTNELQAAHADLNAVLDQALILVKHEMDRAHVALVKACQPLPSCALDLTKVEQVFVNLFMNAIQAMPAGGTLTVRTYATPPRRLYGDPAAPDAASATVREAAVVAEVEDAGSGIPEDLLSKVFDPFFTTKPTGKGTGLGLTVCKKIVELHQGRIMIANRPAGGIQVRLVFPLADGGLAGPTGRAAPPLRASEA